MIKSNLPEFDNDLKEVAVLFDEAEISHTASFFDGKMQNEITVNGKPFCYLYDFIPTDAITDKRYKKRYSKLSVYKALSAYFSKEMPWGALTGIRPTKLAYSEIERTGSFKDFFKSVMLVSEKKTELIGKIIDEQTGIYEKNDDNYDLFNCRILRDWGEDNPDGMAIDGNGDLYVALFGGSRVEKIDAATGKTLQKIYLPVPNVTSLCFIDENYSELFVTTAAYNTDLNRYPYAGSVFKIFLTKKGERI